MPDSGEWYAHVGGCWGARMPAELAFASVWQHPRNVLEVGPGATEKEIKSAARQIRLKVWCTCMLKLHSRDINKLATLP